jgi:hypothetical protein
MANPTRRLIDDKTFAANLCMSPSWVRGQRHKRRNNLPHILNIDPVMVGASPRYPIEEVEAFNGNLSAAGRARLPTPKSEAPAKDGP